MISHHHTEVVDNMISSTNLTNKINQFWIGKLLVVSGLWSKSMVFPPTIRDSESRADFKLCKLMTEVNKFCK